MRKRFDREGPVHASVLDYLRLRFPKAVIHHSPNETSLKGPDVARMIGKQKRMGMVTGFPDLMVLTSGWPFMAFEVKAENGRTTDAQEAVGAAIQAAGGRWAVVRGIADVADALAGWEADMASVRVPIVDIEHRGQAK